MRHLLLLVFLAAAAHSRDSLLVWQDEFNTPGQPDPARTVRADVGFVA